MRFRPCIDIHKGKVKQIVGGSLRDKDSQAEENFVSDKGAEYFAELYRENGLTGGHIILLDPRGTEYHKADREQAFAALAAFPGGMQIGGGVTDENAAVYLEKGASHVIVTSFVFRNGSIDMNRLDRLVSAAGREHIVLDLSCRKRDGKYMIVTDRWQKFTDTEVNRENILALSGYCDEFLIHAVDAEGKKRGIERDIVSLLGDIPGVTASYAGGVGSYEDIRTIRTLGKGRVDFTVGSALDLFGGNLSFDEVIKAAEQGQNTQPPLM